MKLPIPLDYAPMDARTAREIPQGPDWQYEPKWDGFRCLAFRDGGEIKLVSKAGQELERYFPEVLEHLAQLDARRFVLDGELMIIHEDRADFDMLLQRIHPAASRIKKLSRETPATFVLFDMLLGSSGPSLEKKPLAERRKALEEFAHSQLDGISTIFLSPSTCEFKEARRWLFEMPGMLDGIVAKKLSEPYNFGGRDAMVKVKNIRSADCVVGGFRYAAANKVVGSLLLGLYNAQGKLDHVGFTSGIKRDEKPGLTKQLEELIQEPGFDGARPGGPSRWSTERSSEWQPLTPKLVAEVEYDHFSGGRFRHGTRFIRWRPDKAPAKCTRSQVEFESQSPLLLLTGKSRH
jgi:ATP-dependent DNA ligase